MRQRRLPPKTTCHIIIAAKRLLLKLACICLTAIKTAHHRLVCLTDYSLRVVDIGGITLGHAWVNTLIVLVI